MMKKLVVLLACLSLSFQMTGCTSKDSQKDSDAAVDMDSADLEKLEGDEALEIANDDSVSSGSDAAAALGETDASHGSDSLEVVDNDALPADPFAEAPTSTDTPKADIPADTSTDVASTDSLSTESTPAPSYENPTMAESSSSTYSETTTTSTYPGSDSSTTYVEDAPVKASAPLQKVPTAPWKSGGTLYNTVYFAKPGDSLRSISKMLYGNTSHVSELKKGNASFASRDVKPFDKVYYNSPLRPTDDARMMNYYEDNGMAPEVYIAKEGDNIRKVSQKLLGHSQAWKEVWASNSVDSKGELPAGTELRYWKGTAAAAAPPSQELASSQPLPPAPPMPEAHNEMPPAPDMAAHDQMIPPPPMEDPMAQQQAANEMPPPPMPEAPADMPPPPPPAEAFNPPAPPAHDMVAEEDTMNVDNNSTMALGVVGLAAAGLAALVVIRKKRKQKELEQQAFDSTQVGT